MVMPLSVSKLDLVGTRTAETVTRAEKGIVILSHGNGGLPVRQLLGNNVVETTVVMTTIVMEVPHHRGQLVAAVVTITVAMDKVVVMGVLPAVELLRGNDRRTLLHLLPQAISMAMVDIQEAMVAQVAATVVSRPWVLRLVLVVGPVVLVLHQVWVLYSRIMARVELQVALHHHHLRMIFLHQYAAHSLRPKKTY